MNSCTFTWSRYCVMPALTLSLGLTLAAGQAYAAPEGGVSAPAAATAVSVKAPVFADVAVAPAQNAAASAKAKTANAVPSKAPVFSGIAAASAGSASAEAAASASSAKKVQTRPAVQKAVPVKSGASASVQQKSAYSEADAVIKANRETKAQAPSVRVYSPAEVPDASKAAVVSSDDPAGPMLPSEVGDIPGAPVYTMADAMRTAMENSPSLKAARASYEQAKGAVDEARVGGRPTVNLSAGYTFTLPEISTEMEGRTMVLNHKHNYSLSLVFQQAIATFGRLHYAVLAAQMAEYSALESYRTALEAQLASTADNYLNVLQAQETVIIAEEQLSAQQASLKQAEDLFEGGTVAKFDVLRVRSAVSSAEISLIEAKNLLRLAKASLCSDMGLPEGTEFNLAKLTWQKVPRNVVVEYDLDKSIDEALARRPEIKAAEWAREAARARLELSRNSRNPNLALQSTISATRKSTMGSSKSWVTGLVLAVPVYDGGEEAAQTKQLSAAVDVIEANLDSVRRGVRLEVEKCYYNLNSRWERIVQARVGLEQAEEAYRVASVRYSAGLSTPTELLDSQTALVSAKRSLASAKYSYLGANIDWMLATSGAYPFAVDGPLDVSDIKAELNAWYQDADVSKNKGEELINPVKDKDIPERYQEEEKEPALRDLNEQIRKQSVSEPENQPEQEEAQKTDSGSALESNSEASAVPGSDGRK